MLITYALTDLPNAARQFVQVMGARTVFALRGAMGAGKTTLTRAICHELGVTDEVNSPTFAIVNEYQDAHGLPIYHLDCYRLRSLAEAQDIGTEDYLLSGRPCFVEWPEMIEDLLPEDAVDVRITIAPDGTRTLELC